MLAAIEHRFVLADGGNDVVTFFAEGFCHALDSQVIAFRGAEVKTISRPKRRWPWRSGGVAFSTAAAAVPSKEWLLLAALPKSLVKKGIIASSTADQRCGSVVIQINRKFDWLEWSVRCCSS